MASTTTAPAASSVLFARGVVARLAIWPTMKVAVQESWGGPQSAEKRSWVAGVVVDTFESTIPSPDDQYIEELLLQILEDEFDVTLEDGSAEVVARDLVRLWEDTKEGKDEGVRKFEDLAEKSKKKVAEFVEQAQSDEEDWSDEDGEDEDDGDEAPQLIQPEQSRRVEPEVDEEGFTLVKTKGKGRK